MKDGEVSAMDQLVGVPRRWRRPGGHTQRVLATFFISSSSVAPYGRRDGGHRGRRDGEDGRMRRLIVPAVGLAVALGVVGCSTGNADPGIASAGGPAGAAATGGPSAGSDGRANGIELARCLRRNGVDAGDPAGAGGKPVIAEGTDQGEVDAAMATCRELAPNYGQPAPAMDEATLAMWREWAACLRGEGIDAEDPRPGDARPSIPEAPRGQGAALTVAMEVCNKVLPEDQRVTFSGSDGPKGEG
jgi:hypothetical protein